MQGFYVLAMRRMQRQKRIALLACALAFVCAILAARAYFADVPEAVMTAAPDMSETSYVAQSENGLLTISRGGETVIRTEIDVRTLPEADREALAQGVLLPDAEALAKLLEDYGS